MGLAGVHPRDLQLGRKEKDYKGQSSVKQKEFKRKRMKGEVLISDLKTVVLDA